METLSPELLYHIVSFTPNKRSLPQNYSTPLSLHLSTSHGWSQLPPEKRPTKAILLPQDIPDLLEEAAMQGERLAEAEVFPSPLWHLKVLVERDTVDQIIDNMPHAQVTTCESCTQSSLTHWVTCLAQSIGHTVWPQARR
jgi:hypothetical protein